MGNEYIDVMAHYKKNKARLCWKLSYILYVYELKIQTGHNSWFYVVPIITKKNRITVIIH